MIDVGPTGTCGLLGGIASVSGDADGVRDVGEMAQAPHTVTPREGRDGSALKYHSPPTDAAR
jgi:hypothetical protein